jgi:hypothetical protein
MRNVLVGSLLNNQVISVNFVDGINNVVSVNKVDGVVTWAWRFSNAGVD